MLHVSEVGCCRLLLFVAQVALGTEANASSIGMVLLKLLLQHTHKNGPDLLVLTLPSALLDPDEYCTSVYLCNY